jgi:hypothetical protein
MIAIVVNTPLDLNDVVCSISCHHGIAPVVTGLIVVHADPGIISTWSTAANLSCFQIRPSSNRLKDRALRTSVNASLMDLI